jgi:hypothetical protein
LSPHFRSRQRRLLLEDLRLDRPGLAGEDWFAASLARRSCSCMVTQCKQINSLQALGPVS